jgi:secreted trypsin-like serine protease
MKRLATALFLSAAGLDVSLSSTFANELQVRARGLRPSADCSLISTRIVGGKPTCIEEWPWQVALYHMDHERFKQHVFHCGGSVIGDRWILTAGHCVARIGRPQDFKILSGETRAPAFLSQARRGAAISDVRNVFVHEHYHDDDYDGKETENDIALLELDRALSISPVDILRQPNPVLEVAGKSADLIGFGSLRPSDKKGRDRETGRLLSQEELTPERLMHVALPLVELAQCAKANQGGRGPVDERTLCAGVPEGGKDACQGDSGGPMIVKKDDGSFVQIGVVSWGASCGKAGYPGVYTRVSAFADWIGEKARNLSIEPDLRPHPPAPPLPEFDNAAGVAVAIAQGDALRIGEAVTLRATTKRPGYLVLLDLTADDRIIQIFPNEYSLRTPMGQDPRGNLLTPERPRSIGNVKANPYAGFAYEIGPPKGRGALIAILSETPITSLDIPSTPKSFSRAESETLLARIREELRSRHVSRAAEGQTMNWSIDIHPYTVE